MNDIEVGEFVRLRGEILKIDFVSYNSCGYTIKFEGYECSNGFSAEEIQNWKHSKNIIDILEVGDYVNGSRIIYADSLTGYMKEIYLEEAPDDGVWCEEIKSVLTHEQYESNAYRLEE